MRAALAFLCRGGPRHYGNILCCGDSQTHGGKYVTHAYRERMDVLLAANGHQYNWVGPRTTGAHASGKTSADNGWAGADTSEVVDGTGDVTGSFASHLTTYAPSLVIWMTGLNDWFKSDDQARPYRNYWLDPTVGAAVQAYALATARTDYQAMLDAAFNYASTLTLVWVNVQKIDETLAEADDAFNYEGYNDFASQFNTLINTMGDEQRALGRKVKVIDAYSWVVTATHLGADGKHWITAGSNTMGDYAYGGLF